MNECSVQHDIYNLTLSAIKKATQQLKSRLIVYPYNVGRIGVFYGNKSTTLQNVTTTLHMTDELKECMMVDLKPIPTTIEGGAQKQQLVDVECKNIFFDAPKIEIKFKSVIYVIVMSLYLLYYMCVVSVALHIRYFSSYQCSSPSSWNLPRCLLLNSSLDGNSYRERYKIFIQQPLNVEKLSFGMQQYSCLHACLFEM